MTGRERVKRAISFDSPDRIPIFFWNRDEMEGDILSFELFPYKGDVLESEWGYTWENLGDGTIGQPKKAVIPTWDHLKDYRFPAADKPGRFEGAGAFIQSTGGRYTIAEMGITGFNTYAFLRGFGDALVDFKLQRKKAEHLIGRILDFEMEVIGLAAEHGFDGIHFADDWGHQRGMLIDPELWRELFKPLYRREFDFVHGLGMQVWFHCCGDITEIVADFHEIGVDVMNISQPNAVDIDAVGARLRGRQCFMVPISYQTVSISGTPRAIEEEGKRLFDALGTSRGGFIGYVEEYGVMGMPAENYKACIRAFRNLQ
jgi:hypothetical protein